MSTKQLLLCALYIVFLTKGYAQKIATLEVNVSQPANGLRAPIKMSLDNITFLPDSVINLVEVNGNNRTPVPFQVEHGGERMLYFIPQGNQEKKKLDRYWVLGI